jgi:hypothetical protein
MKKISIANIQIEDFLSKVDIQSHMLNLLSDNKENVRIALLNIAYAAQLTGRRDCLIALAGYYVLEVRSIADSEFFIKTTKLAHSPELARIVMNDLIRKQEISRHRLFINELINILGTIILKSSPEQTESLMQQIDSAVWGDKLKFRFRTKLSSILDD